MQVVRQAKKALKTGFLTIIIGLYPFVLPTKGEAANILTIGTEYTFLELVTCQFIECITDSRWYFK